jgi:hypothetical protein
MHLRDCLQALPIAYRHMTLASVGAELGEVLTMIQNAEYVLGSAQKFPPTHAAVYNTFTVQRHLVSAQTRALRADSMTTWRTAVAAA